MDLLPFLDEGSFVAADDPPRHENPLAFPGYEELLSGAVAKSGYDESVVSGAARLSDHDVEVAGFAFGFLGGSMGEDSGERLSAAMERAAARGAPFILRTSTGGARMQEGMRSLVQMPKVVVARRALASAAVPFVAVLGHPTTGGVLASLGALADVTVAEADATIGFAGPRVAASFTGEQLPAGSHTSGAALAAGLVDEVVPSSDVRTYLTELLAVLTPPQPRPGAPLTEPTQEEVDAWHAVDRARAAERISGPELVTSMSESFVELRGDRAGRDDPAFVCGLARVRGRPLVAIAMDREQSPGPHAYRKAQRCIALAERLRLPVVTLIDTRGADPSAASEREGIAWAIASTFDALLGCRTPVVSVVTGEGGSGGALALATGDRLIAFSDSIFSVIGPEGAAAILWRDASRADEAARLLRLTALDLSNLGIADRLLSGPPAPDALADAVVTELDAVGAQPDMAARHSRWRDK